MRLNTLTLYAFKGVRQFTLDANGDDVDIYAANGAGKTSTSDAFSWLLFGKDSLGRSDFGIIPTDENGLVVEGASPTVAATLGLPSGESITLQRRLKLKTESVRGAAPTAAGTTTDFSINGVPVKKTEYARRIAEIADDQLFPLLTDPHAICGSLHWQKRRDLLLRLFSATTDAEIMAGDPDLADLPAILGNRGIGDHRRMLAARLADLKKQLAAIPARIGGMKRGFPPAPFDGPNIAALRIERGLAQAKLERIANGGESAELRRQLAEANARILDAETAARRTDAERLDRLVGARRAVRETLAEREGLLSDAEWRIDSASDEISRLRAESELLAAMSESIAARPPPAVGFDDACPSCGQTLPAENLRAAVDRAMAEHNRERSEALEDVISRAGTITKQLADAEHTRGSLVEQAEQMRASCAEAAKLLDDADSAVQDFTPTPLGGWAIFSDSGDIAAKIFALESGNAEALDAARADLDRIDAQIAAEETAIADARAREQIDAQFAAAQTALASDLDTVEGELTLCDLFTRRKIEQTTEAINSRFGILQWKLFDQQVNGEVSDCCEVTLGGVPWRDLSNSQQINVGLAVIDVIGQHYGITPPIFIDNAESVSTIRPTTAQQIRLIVSAAHKRLTVEVAK